MITLILPMAKIFPRIKDINFEIDEFAGRDFKVEETHGEDASLEVLEVVAGLVGADDDVELGEGFLLDGVHGVVEEVFADVEFVFALAHGFFVFGGFVADDVFDVGGCVGDADDGVGYCVCGLGGWD